MTAAQRLALRWAPVGLGLALLLGFVGYKLYERTVQRQATTGYRTPPAVSIVDGTPPDPKNPSTELLHKLGLALSLRDATAAERVAEELSRRGEDTTAALSRLLLWADPVPTPALLSGVVKYFSPRTLAMGVIFEVSKAQWIGIGPEPRKARLAEARDILLQTKEMEPAIDLNALLAPRFDQSPRADGRYGVAVLAVHVKASGWERLARAVLPSLQDLEAREELLQAVTDAFGRQVAAPLRSLR